MSSSAKAHIALLVVSVIYGANYIIAKDVLAQKYIHPYGFVLLRALSGVFFFWTFHTIFIREKTRLKDHFLLFVCSIFGVAANQLFFFTGLNLTLPINASLIQTTTPIIVFVIAAILSHESILLRKIAGVVLGAAGALYLIYKSSSGTSDMMNNLYLKGNLFILLNATSFGLFLVLIKPLMRRYNPVTVVKWLFTYGILFIAPFGWSKLETVTWGTFPLTIWMGVIYVLVFTTILAYLLNAYALSKVRSTVVSSYIYLQPLVASIIAVMTGKDTLESFKIYCAIFIFFGVYLISKTENSKKTSLSTT